MTTYTGHRVEDHEDFILEQLLQAKGLGRDVLMRAIDAARLQTHEALEGLQ